MQKNGSVNDKYVKFPYDKHILEHIKSNIRKLTSTLGGTHKTNIFLKFS